MAIDPKQLQRDAKRLQKARRRLRGDGTTAAIRAALPTIYKLRADGVLWSEIAAALGDQGVTQGSGNRRIPITTNRLTSIVRQVEQETTPASPQQGDVLHICRSILNESGSKLCVAGVKARGLEGLNNSPEGFADYCGDRHG